MTMMAGLLYRLPLTPKKKGTSPAPHSHVHVQRSCFRGQIPAHRRSSSLFAQNHGIDFFGEGVCFSLAQQAQGRVRYLARVLKK